MTNERFSIWLAFALGLLICGGIAIFANGDAKDSGEAFGFALVPALAGGALAAFLAYRHNSNLARGTYQRHTKDLGE